VAAAVAGNPDRRMRERSRHQGITGSQQRSAVLFVVEIKPTEAVCESLSKKFGVDLGELALSTNC